MIDWLRLRLPVSVAGLLPVGTVLWLDSDGSVERQKPLSVKVRGSYERTIIAFACPVTGFLVIDGNPAKFLQGHNVFGSDDVELLARAMVRCVLDSVDIPLFADERERLLSCDIEIFRVDGTESYDVGSRANAEASVRGLSQNATLVHRGRGLMAEGTVYFGKHSRVWSIKAYSKGAELRSATGKLPKELPFFDDVQRFADPLLRVEVVLRRPELEKRGLGMLSDWRGLDVAALFSEYRSKLTVSDNTSLSAVNIDGLPPRLRVVYDSWQRGTDLRAVLPRMTFYRYRKALMAFGVDIACIKDDAMKNVVPLVRIIEARPVGIPDWAKGTPILFDGDWRKRA